MVAVFSKDCDQGRSLFLKTAVMVEVFFLKTAVMVAVFSKDCDQGRSLFLRTAIMVAVLITLKIYDFLKLRLCYSGLRPRCSKFATILK